MKTVKKEKFKVNVLNARGKEVWRYCSTIKGARRLQEIATLSALCSFIFQKGSDGKWKII